jgi:hypothetical protein
MNVHLMSCNDDDGGIGGVLEPEISTLIEEEWAKGDEVHR